MTAPAGYRTAADVKNELLDILGSERRAKSFWTHAIEEGYIRVHFVADADAQHVLALAAATVAKVEPPEPKPGETPFPDDNRELLAEAEREARAQGLADVHRRPG